MVEKEKEPDALLVLCSFLDKEQARQIGTVLLEKQLCACFHICATGESHFVWEGELQSEGEVLVWFKTSRSAYASLEEELLLAHPYEVPEVLALPVAAGSQSYLDWLQAACLPSEKKQ